MHGGSMSTREELELSKLALEVRHLQTPQTRTPTFWISVATALVAVIGVFAQNYLSNIQAAQAKLERAQAEQARDDAKRDIEELGKRRTALENENVKLLTSNKELTLENQRLDAERKNSKDQLASVLAASKSTPAGGQSQQLVSALANAANSLYSIGLYSFGVPESQLQAATNVLAQQGYTIITSSLMNTDTSQTRPKWMANRSTVLYYSEQTRQIAETIARQLEAATGLKFAVNRGAGLGIPEGEEKTNLRVHLIS